MHERSSAGLLTAVVLIALLATAGCTTTVVTTSAAAPDTVTVTGSGTGSSAPDRATLSMSVNAHARSSSDAMNSATKAMDRLVVALKAAGLSDAELQTQQVSVYQQGGPRGSSYQANQALKITTKQLDMLGKFVAEATRAGASGISGPDFSLVDQRSVQARAIAAAMKDARTRASVMAKSAGRGLGRVVSVSDVTRSSSSPYSNNLVGGLGAGVSFQYLAAQKATIAPNVSPGRVTASAQMTVVFALQ